MFRSSSGVKQSLAVHRGNDISAHSDSSEFRHGPGGLLFMMVHSGSVCVWLFCWYFLVIKLSLSHCSGLSNTESGSTEIFSFFSGQLYSFGSFVYTKRNDIQGKTGKPLNKTNQKLK